MHSYDAISRHRQQSLLLFIYDGLNLIDSVVATRIYIYNIRLLAIFIYVCSSCHVCTLMTYTRILIKLLFFINNPNAMYRRRLNKAAKWQWGWYRFVYIYTHIQMFICMYTYAHIYNRSFFHLCICKDIHIHTYTKW